MNRPCSAPVLLLAACALAATGCFSLAPKDDPVRHFVLRATVQSPPQATAAAEPSLGIRRVHLPDYLNARPLASRRSPTEIAYARFDLWGEPLATGVQRVIRENLSTLLGNPPIRLDDWPAETVQFVLRLNLDRFEPDATGTVHLAARWTLNRATAAATARSGQLTLNQPAASSQPADITEAMSLVLTDLSRRIAEDLQTLSAAGL